MSQSLPQINFAALTPTRSAMHKYCRVVGAIRRMNTPVCKHWWHSSLRACSIGLTTTPIAAASITYEIILDFTTHSLLVTTSRGDRWRTVFYGQSPKALADQLIEGLAQLQIEPAIIPEVFSTVSEFDEFAYVDTDAAALWQVFSQADWAFKTFVHEQRHETSPVQLWPHHMDMAVSWYSGRLVPNVNTANEETADESLTFGFSPGDRYSEQLYFYATAYPQPDAFRAIRVPDGAYWSGQEFEGYVLPYDALCGYQDPIMHVVEFCRTVLQGAQPLMVGSKWPRSIATE